MTVPVAPSVVPTVESPIDGDAIGRNALALRDMVRAEADETERLGRLTPTLVEAFRVAGLYRMGFPRRVGGPEVTLADQTRIVAAIARVDASAGWNVAVLAGTGFYATRLDDVAFGELYPTLDLPTCGSFWPRGRADVVDGGYLVSGEWDWGSGIYSSDHIIGGCYVYADGEPVLGANGQQHVCGVWLPPKDVKTLDNWQTLGLRGSGSTSYAVRGQAFVPVGYTFDRYAAPGTFRDPLNRHVELLFFSLMGIYPGLARGALDVADQALRHRARIGSATSRLYGEGLACVHAMESAIIEVASRYDDVVFGDPVATLTDVELAEERSVSAMAGDLLRRVLDDVTEICGARSVMDSHPLNRIVRDAQTALTHVGTKRDAFSDLGEAAIGASSHAGGATDRLVAKWQR